VEVKAGNLSVARDHQQRSHVITETLAKADPHGAQAQRDLSFSLEMLGDIEVEDGNLPVARIIFSAPANFANRWRRITRTVLRPSATFPSP
jgi:hypothetical protein